MDLIAHLLFVIVYGWMFALIIIGPFQVLASVIRAYNLEDWTSDFGKKLKRYFQLLLAYWVAAGITYFILTLATNAEWIFLLFVPVLCTLLAIYYWRAVYLLYKEKRRIKQQSENI